jgi:glycosyltransferase involved in cell wall biosynthesis
MLLTSPVVSIGLPVYNGNPHIVNALNSLLNQTFKDFELIISDNGSLDDTWNICQQYAEKDTRIRLYRNTVTVGVGDNFLRVLNLARGDFFMWAAHDDEWHLEFIEKCLAALYNNPTASLCYCQSEIVNHVSNTKTIDAICNNNSSIDAKQKVYNQLIANCPPPNAIYGLFRREKLINSSRSGFYVYGGDRVILLRTVLSGEVIALNETLRTYNHYYAKRISTSNAYIRHTMQSINGSNPFVDLLWKYKLGEIFLIWYWYWELFFALMNAVWQASAPLFTKLESSYLVLRFMNKRGWPIHITPLTSSIQRKFLTVYRTVTNRGELPK